MDSSLKTLIFGIAVAAFLLFMLMLLCFSPRISCLMQGGVPINGFLPGSQTLIMTDCKIL